MKTAEFILYTYFAAFAGVVPPGLVNMAVAKVALKKNKRNGIYAALGVCVVNFIHALIAILAARYLIRHVSIQDDMLRIGVGVFAGLAIYFLIVAIRNKPHTTNSKRHNSGRSFVKGFFIANLNILPIPYFVFISTQLKTTSGDSYDWWHILLFSISAAVGTFTILYLYIVTFLRLEKHTNLLLKYANYFMAGLMFILSIITLFRVYYGG